jgi:hypothetical protein
VVSVIRSQSTHVTKALEAGDPLSAANVYREIRNSETKVEQWKNFFGNREGKVMLLPDR